MTQGFFFAHTVERAPSPEAKLLTRHTTFKNAQAAARKHSKVAKTALVLERDYESGLSTILERWEDGVCIKAAS
jgi:hypothetical protein